MTERLLARSFKVRGGDYDKAGEVSDEIKRILKELQITPELVRRTVVVAFEGEMNIVMYAYEGTINLVLTSEEISLKIDDIGPGIEDIKLAMTEGFSTATEEMRLMGFGFGMGLPNIKKNSDFFKIESEVGAGTSLTSVIWLGEHE
jgi:serine/threonine-protein kinase RsbT